MRLEIGIRDQKSRKLIKCITIEAELRDVERALSTHRGAVLDDITRRLMRSREIQNLSQLKRSDFFDSKGRDIGHVPFKIVQKIKGNTSIQLRRCFKWLQYLGYKNAWKRFDNLWARGYYCGSAGHVSQEAVKRYILEQQGKDVFEYNIFGGQTKIGDFTGGSA